MEGKYILACTAILSLTAIEIVALMHNINGTLLIVSAGAISAICAGTVGYTLNKVKSN